jgi:transposase
MGFRTLARNQIDLLGFSLDDLVEPDAKCRFIVHLVSQLNLDSLYGQYSDVGNYAIDPSALLATWFLGYSEAITGSRKLESRCKRDTHFMYTSCNLKPDHTTLSRFRKRHLDLIPDYFVEIIRLAQKNGISDFKHITIDGTKIQAASSPRKSKDAEALDRYLAAVRENIAEYMKQCDEIDLLDGSISTDTLSEIQEKLQKLKDLENTLIERKNELEQRKQTLRKYHQQTHQINIVEPEAFNMRHANGKQTLPAYNAQASVDAETQLIVAADLVQDRADFDLFSRQHQIIENNLGQDPKRMYTADSGYHNLEQLEYIEEHQIDAIINDLQPESRSLNKENPDVKELQNSKRRLERSDFVYDSQEDKYICPSGRSLNLTGIKTIRKRPKRIYQSDNCNDCLLIEQCLSKKNKTNIRCIQRDRQEILAEQMAMRLNTQQAKDRLFVRKTTAEPVFGNLKSNLGFRRFSLRGLENVRNEFNLMAIAHNINKLYKLKERLLDIPEKIIVYILKICNLKFQFDL